MKFSASYDSILGHHIYAILHTSARVYVYTEYGMRMNVTKYIESKRMYLLIHAGANMNAGYDIVASTPV